MRFHDILVGLFFIALAALMIGYTTTFPAFPGQKYGPSLFPRIIGAGIVLCGLLILLRGWRGQSSHGGQPLVVIDPHFGIRSRRISFILIPGGILFYLVAADRLGFIPTAFLMLISLFLWFRVHIVWALGIAVIMTAAMQWFFGSLMRVPLPRGLFMQLIYGG